MDPKTYTLLALLLCGQLSSTVLSRQEPLPSHVIINHPTIRLLDGTPKADVLKMIQLERKIRDVQAGDSDGYGLISYRDQQYTLKELVELERECTEKNLSQGSCNHLKEALICAIKQVDMIFRPYLAEVRNYFVVPVAKLIYCGLIEQWAAQRRIDTVLKECKKYEIDDTELLLKKLAPSLEGLDELLTDLSLFLKDFRFSSKKSLQFFLESIGASKEKKP